MATTKQSKTNLEEWARRALQSRDAKRKPKRATLHVPSLKAEITIRDLATDEINECVEKNNEGGAAGDRYSVYLACVDPDLAALAVQLKQQEEIKEYTEVVEMLFTPSEIGDIATQVMRLSGQLGDKVTVVDKLKN